VTTWKLTLEFDGTRYSGWQDQKNARTIVGELRKAAEDWFGGKVDIQGSGRTDAGVHALAQVAHLRTEAPGSRQPREVLRALNDRLPVDIVVYEAERVPNSFHARHDAVSRIYRYQISTRKTAFSKKYTFGG
jgi:tRNA pseudouridine38-40 synthase